MPMFDYQCPECEKAEERIVPYDKSRLQKCDACGQLMQRSDVHVVNGHIAVETGARMWDGTRVKGRFGKANKKKRRQYHAP